MSKVRTETSPQQAGGATANGTSLLNKLLQRKQGTMSPTNRNNQDLSSQ